MPAPNRPPGVSCSPMCGGAAGSVHGVTPTAGRRTEATCLKPIARSARAPAADSTADRGPSRSGRAATRSRVALRSGWIASRAPAGTATPSRSSPAADRSAIGSRPGSSEPRKADVRLRDSPSRSASSPANSSVRRPSRVNASVPWPATVTATV